MSQLATCPSCKNRLVVPSDTTERWLTCPRCLSSVGNPNVLLTAERPAETAPSAPLSETRTCPACDRAVEPNFRYCPHCNEPLRRRRTTGKQPLLDRDVKRDTSANWVVVYVLVGLVVLGEILFFAGAGPKALAGSSGEIQGWITLVVLLIGIVVIVCVILGTKSKGTTGGIVSGIMGGVTVGIGVALVAFLTVVAAIIDAIHTCLSCGRPH